MAEKTSDQNTNRNRALRRRNLAAAGLTLLALTACTAPGTAPSTPTVSASSPDSAGCESGTYPNDIVRAEVKGHSLPAQRAAFVAAFGDITMPEADWDWIDRNSRTYDSTKASGRYLLPKTLWNDYKGYEEAYQASPATQYEFVDDFFADAYKRHKDWDTVAVRAAYGGSTTILEVDCISDDDKSSGTYRFHENIIGAMNAYMADPATIPEIPGMSTEETNPALHGR